MVINLMHYYNRGQPFAVKITLRDGSCEETYLLSICFGFTDFIEVSGPKSILIHQIQSITHPNGKPIDWSTINFGAMNGDPIDFEYLSELTTKSGGSKNWV